MPNTASAKKRLRQNVVRRARNRALKSSIRTQMKKVVAAIDASDASTADAEFRLLQKKLDRGAARGALHANAAARVKSRLNVRLKALKTA